LRTSPVLNACNFKSIEEIDFKVDMFQFFNLSGAPVVMSSDWSRNGQVWFFKILNFFRVGAKITLDCVFTFSRLL